jgi:hypothetical protein
LNPLFHIQSLQPDKQERGEYLHFGQGNMAAGGNNFLTSLALVHYACPFVHHPHTHTNVGWACTPSQRLCHISWAYRTMHTMIRTRETDKHIVGCWVGTASEIRMIRTCRLPESPLRLRHSCSSRETRRGHGDVTVRGSCINMLYLGLH